MPVARAAAWFHASARPGQPAGRGSRKRRERLESAAVAERQGIRLLYPDPVAAVEEVCRRTATNFSSMLQDVRRGGRTEIDAINGAIIRAAAALDLATPVNTDLVRRLRAASG